METQKVVEYLNELLRIQNIEDTSLNGLQVDNNGNTTRIALAVDASYESIKRAKELNSDLLLVHHGLFWGNPVPITGVMFKRIQLLIQANIGLYAVHLPLDQHEIFGNNAQIGLTLGWPITGDFGEYHGTVIGKEIKLPEPVPLQTIVNEVKIKLRCQPVVWDFGKKHIQRIGFVSGGALSMLDQAINADLDLFITGEPCHSSYWIAREASINVVFAGHYATETLGVKAIGDRLIQEFGLETCFIDLPTGL